MKIMIFYPAPLVTQQAKKARGNRRRGLIASHLSHQLINTQMRSEREEIEFVPRGAPIKFDPAHFCTRV